MVAQFLVEFPFDGYRIGEGAVIGIPEALERAVLRLVRQMMRLALEVGDLLLENHAVNLEFLVAGGGEVGGFLAEPFHFELEHFPQVVGGIGGVQALHPDFLVLLEQRVRFEIRVEGFGELFEEGFEVAVFGVFHFEAFALLFGLGFGQFAAGLGGGWRGIGVFAPGLESRAQALVGHALEFFGIASRVEIAEIVVEARRARGLFHHLAQEFEFLVLALLHPLIVLVGTEFLDDGLQLSDFLRTEAHGIGQQITRLAAQQIAEPVAALGAELEGLQGFASLEDEIPVRAVEILDQRHQLPDGGGERVVEPCLLAGVAGLGGFETFHEAVEFHLRAAEWRVLPRADDQALLVVGRLVWSLSFHRADLPGGAREVNGMSRIGQTEERRYSID